jgi:hypothetical protein
MISNGEMLNATTKLKINEKNKHKLIIFSTCSIGQNASLCQSYLELFSAQAVVAYRTRVSDDICFIAEPAALLQLFRYDPSHPVEAVEKVCQALDPWKIVNNKHSKKFPLVCYSH